MKHLRLWIAVGLIIIIITLCSLATWDMSHQVKELQGILQDIRNTPPTEQAQLVALCNHLVTRWKNAESHFVLYVFHDNIDRLAQTIAELPALALYSEHSHLYSHVDAASVLLEDMWQAAIPSYRTLL